jgi:hypothetical protein
MRSMRFPNAQAWPSSNITDSALPVAGQDANHKIGFLQLTLYLRCPVSTGNELLGNQWSDAVRKQRGVPRI